MSLPRTSSTRPSMIFRLLDRLLGFSEWREQAPHMFDGVLAARTVADLAAEEV